MNNLSVPSLGVYLAGEEAGVKLARQVLQSVTANKLVTEVHQQTAAAFRIRAWEQQYFLTRATNNLRLVPPIAGYSLDNAQRVIQYLDHITRWHHIVELSNPTSQIADDAIKIEIYQGEQAIPIEDVYLNYQYVNGEWLKPSFRVKLTNQSQQPLYCGLVVLAESYKIETRLLSGVWLQPQQEYWTRKVNSSLARKSQQPEVTKRRDILKLITCTQDFDLTLVHQTTLAKLSDDSAQPRGKIKQLRNIPLNQLLQQVHNHQVEFTEAEKADWTTTQMLLTTIRPHTPEPTFELNVVATKNQKIPLPSPPKKSLPEQRIFAPVVEDTNYLRLAISLLAGIVASLIIFGFLYWQYYPQEKVKQKQDNTHSPTLNRQEKNVDESLI